MGADVVSEGRTWYRSHDWDGWPCGHSAFCGQDGDGICTCDNGRDTT